MTIRMTMTNINIATTTRAPSVGLGNNFRFSLKNSHGIQPAVYLGTFWNISLQVKLFADALDTGSFDKHFSPLIIQAGSFETHPLHHFLILTILIILLVLLIPRVSEEASNCTSMFIDYRQCRTRSEIYWDKKREGRVFIPSRSQNSPKPHRRVIFLRAGFHFQISSVFPPPPPIQPFFASCIWLWHHLWMAWCNSLQVVPNNS